MRSWRQATDTSLRLLLDCLSQSGVEHEVSARVPSPCNSAAIMEAGAELCCRTAVANRSCSFSESERGEWATLCRRVRREPFSAVSCSRSARWSCGQRLVKLKRTLHLHKMPATAVLWREGPDLGIKVMSHVRQLNVHWILESRHLVTSTLFLGKEASNTRSIDG